MSRTYDVVAMDPGTEGISNPLHLGWGLATARRFLRDTPNDLGAWHPRSFLDVEIKQQLFINAAYDGDTRYYRPHATAAYLLRADPQRVLSFSGGGYSEKYDADAERLARAILAGGQAIDDWINEHAGREIVSTGRVARVVF